MDFIKGYQFNKKNAGVHVILMDADMYTEAGEIINGLNVYDEIENIDDDCIGFKVVHESEAPNVLRKNVKVGYVYMCNVMVDDNAQVKKCKYGCEATRIIVDMESCQLVSSMEFVSDYESAMNEISKQGLTLQYVSPELHTKEMYILALEQNGISIAFIPEEQICDEYRILALKQNGFVSNFIRYDNMTDEMRGIALNYVFKNVNKPKKNCAIVL